MSFQFQRTMAVGLLLALAPACKSKGNDDGPTGPGPTPTIALAVNPGSATVVQGGNAATTVTLTRGGGFSGAVTISAEGAPTGVTASVGAPQGSGVVTTASVTITVGEAAAAGTHTIVLRGVGPGVAAATVNFQLTITELPNYTLAVTPATVTLVQGGSRNDIAVAITRTNFTGAVTLALQGPVPAGVTASFTPAAPTATSASLAVTVGAATTPGTYQLQVAGTGSPGARTTPLTLTVTQAGSFVLGLNPAGAMSLVPGTSDATRSVSITRTNYAEPITLVAEGLPTGVTASFAPNPASGNTAMMTVTAAAGAALGGPHTITVRGTGPLALRTPDSEPAHATAAVTFPLSIIPAGSFTLGMPAPCAANFQIRQGGYDDRRVVTISRTNFPAALQFAVEGLPAGLTAGFDANPVTSNAVRLRFVASPTLAAAVHPLVVRATGPGGVSVTFPLSVDVRVPSDALDPDLLVWDFTNLNSHGWLRGMVCPFPGAGDTHVDWGGVFFQEHMFGLDGRGPATNRTEPNAWVNRIVNLPANASLFRLDASAHSFDDARAWVRVRIIDGNTSTVILNQLRVGSWPSRIFQTFEASVAPWAGKTVRIVVEQLDDGASHGQLWLDSFRIVLAP